MKLDVVLVPLGIGPLGGFTIDVRNLANGLTARGHDVAVVGVAGPEATLAGLAPAVELIRIPPAPPRRVGLALNVGFGFRRLLRGRPRACVQTFSCLPSYLTFASLAAARREGRPTVWYPSLHPARRRMWEGGRLRRAMVAFDRVAPLAARFVDVVAVNTEVEGAYFERLGARRVEVLPPAVDDAPVLGADAAAAFRARHGLGDAPFVLAVAVRDERRKGLSFGFEAFALLRRDLPQARLLVIGIGASDEPAPDGVVFAGRVSDEDLVAAMRAADVLFVPSLYEAFSRIVIEAWQQATPVVVTDGVALAPTVTAAGAGAVVAFGDVAAAAAALRAALVDPEDARRQGEAGRRLVEERFLVSGMLDRMEALYEELGARRGWR